MYSLIKNESNKNTTDLMNDLHSVLLNAGYTINKFDTILGANSLRGKEIFANKGNSHFSFSATHYSFVDQNDMSDLIIPVDTDDVVSCGSFTVSANTGFDLNENFADQPSNQILSNSKVSSACIPKNNLFNYTIYKTDDDFNFIIKINFDDLNFYVLFGDVSNNDSKTTLARSYIFGSVRLVGAVKKIGYPKNLTERFSQLDNHQIPNHFLMKDISLTGDFWGNIIYYIDSVIVPHNFLETKSSTSIGVDKGVYSNNQSMLAGLSDNYTGADVMLPFELYLPTNTTDSDPPQKRIKEFDFGVFSDENIEDGEIRKVDGVYYEFMHLMKRIEKDRDGSFLQAQNFNLGMYIKRGDIF